MYKINNSGWIEAIIGPMYSGKTEELIRRVKRAKIAEQSCILFKPQLDDRYSEDNIVSHDGTDIKSRVVNTLAELDEIIDRNGKIDVIAIDEVQFFNIEEFSSKAKSFNLLEMLNSYADEGIRVIVTGLDMDFAGRPFKPIPELISMAEYVDKLHAICTICGNPATRTQRIIDGKPAKKDDPLILVGSNEAYEARCRTHHIVL